MKFEKQDLLNIMEIGVLMAKELDRNRLLEMIIESGMKIGNCDAGTLYVYENDALQFKIMKTISLGVDKGGKGEAVDLPPVPLKEENICAYSAIHRKTVNIEDVATSEEFDFSGPRRYDKLTGYKTQSMLVLPITNQEDELIGVLQLINAMDEEGKVIPFAKELEPIILSLASQAAIIMSNILYMGEIQKQMWSFTEAMTEAIDARTPYNGNHTKKVASYAGKIADYINELYVKGETTEFFSPNRKDQLIMSAYLHDVGKMIIPLEVMNKASRLEGKREKIEHRFEMLEAYFEIDRLKGVISEEEYAARKEELDRIKVWMESVDKAGFLKDELKEKMDEYLSKEYTHEDSVISYFEEDEKTCLKVVRGTLTEDERKIMESHVEMTERILKKVRFNKYFEHSAEWASMHHEMLDGSGYPHHLTEESLPLEARIIAVSDISDALLATDRPYKAPMPKEKAFEIMDNMAAEGKLDKKIVEYAKACL